MYRHWQNAWSLLLRGSQVARARLRYAANGRDHCANRRCFGPNRQKNKLADRAHCLRAYWAELLNQLETGGGLNPQYNYRPIGPLLAPYLFWKRLPNRPPPPT